MAGLGYCGDQTRARVADGGGACISGQCNIAVGQRVQDAGQLPLPVMLVAAEQARVGIEMGQQAAGDAGVLGSDQAARRHRMRLARRVRSSRLPMGVPIT